MSENHSTSSSLSLCVYCGSGPGKSPGYMAAARTLGIDIIDAQRRELVWEGAATGRVTDQTRQNRAAAIAAAVAEILAQFP